MFCFLLDFTLGIIIFILQVLEERTHPEMLMDGQSGYILTAVVVQKNSAVQ